MGFRFQKRIQLFKGFSINLSKSGPSVTLGVKGAGVNIRSDKVTGNIGIPGTGLSYRQRLDHNAGRQRKEPQLNNQSAEDTVLETSTAARSLVQPPTSNPGVTSAKRINIWKLLSILLAIILAIVVMRSK